jgi:dTDP-4-amino-4,6-dideoxygalactose transaminase
VVIGYNSKLDALQARILHWKLRMLDQWNESRRRIASWYRERLTALPIGFQAETPSEAHAYHLFVIRTDRRDELLASLRRAGIDAVVRYPVPIHLQPAFEHFNWKCGQFPVAERLAKESLCLPIRADMREEEVDFVASQLSKFFDARSLAAAGGA